MLYGTYIQDDATFLVPLSVPLRQAFRNLLGGGEFRHSFGKLRRSSLSSVSGEANSNPGSDRASDPRTQVELLQAAYREVMDVVDREVLQLLKWVVSEQQQRAVTRGNGHEDHGSTPGSSSSRRSLSTPEGSQALSPG